MKGLVCRDKGFGLEMPVSCEETLEVGALHFNLFLVQGRGFMEGRAWGV